MKRADLVKGEHYAHIERRELTAHSYATEVELLSTVLHTNFRAAGYTGEPGGIRPSRPGARANTGSWNNGPTGLLVRTRTGRNAGEEFIAQPANIRMTWTDWLAWVEAAKADNAKAAAKVREQQAKVQAQTAEIAELLATFGRRSGIRLDRSARVQAISNELLLDILKGTPRDND